MQIYVNGTLVWNQTLAGTDFQRPIRPGGLMALGQTQYTVGGSFNPDEAPNAIFDEYRIWQTARTADDIARNYQYGVDPANPDLVMYHRWDSGSPTTILDQDLSPEPLHQLLMGSLPGLMPFLTWTDPSRLSQVATSPYMVVSDAPIIGAGPQVVLVTVADHGGSNTSFTLMAHDPDNNPLQYSIRTVLDVTRCGYLVTSDGTVITSVNTNITGALTFVPSASFSASMGLDDCSLVYRATQLSGAYTWCESLLVFVADTIRTPDDRTITTTEATPVVIKLGSVELDGTPLIATIQVLPLLGTLYHAAFSSSDSVQYNNLILDVSLLTPVVVGANLTTIGGYSLVIYVPEDVGYSSPALDHPRNPIPYTTFQYAWTDGQLISPAAIINVDVIHADHAPVAKGVTPPRLFNGSSGCNMTSSCGIQLPFSSTDVDTTFSNRTFYRITSWPLLGDLYQVPGLDTGKITSTSLVRSLDTLVMIPATSSATFSWAVAVMRASSQFSNCGGDCFYVETCPKTCTDQEYSVTQILGPNNW